jgi:hypothetical protein
VSGYEVMLRGEARVWSIKFPAAPESTNALETIHEGQSTSAIATKKVLSESDGEAILTPAAGGG